MNKSGNEACILADKFMLIIPQHLINIMKWLIFISLSTFAADYSTAFSCQVYSVQGVRFLLGVGTFPMYSTSRLVA